MVPWPSPVGTRLASHRRTASTAVCRRSPSCSCPYSLPPLVPAESLEVRRPLPLRTAGAACSWVRALPGLCLLPRWVCAAPSSSVASDLPCRHSFLSTSPRSARASLPLPRYLWCVRLLRSVPSVAAAPFPYRAPPGGVLHKSSSSGGEVRVRLQHAVVWLAAGICGRRQHPPLNIVFNPGAARRCSTCIAWLRHLCR